MEEIIIGGTYRHFKGGLYTVLAESLYSKDKTTPMITYALLGGQTYTRPKFDYDGEPGFLTEVDHQKYPEAKQKMRFELVELPLEVPKLPD